MIEVIATGTIHIVFDQPVAVGILVEKSGELSVHYLTPALRCMSCLGVAVFCAAVNFPRASLSFGDIAAATRI
jgi:hypothetical protein